MAFIKNLKRTCAVCGNVHNFQKIVETEGIGMRDLDTRLPGLSRNTITTELGDKVASLTR